MTQKAKKTKKVNKQDAFTLLDPNWQAWLIDNIERGCSYDSIVKAMVEGGPFSKYSAQTALQAAIRTFTTELTTVLSESKCTRPNINTQKNYIEIGQQRIDILVTVNNPRIVVLKNVLSDEECEDLIVYAKHKLTRSYVVSSENLDDIESSERTSSYAMFQRGETDLHDRIEKRLAALANWPLENGEGLQLLRYKKGEFYKPHFDWFNPKIPALQERLKSGGQRVGTFVLYLSDVETGGGTSFPKLDLEVRPQRGMAVFFSNINTNTQPDMLTLHGANPVISGVKWVATKWLREREF